MLNRFKVRSSSAGLQAWPIRLEKWRDEPSVCHIKWANQIFYCQLRQVAVFLLTSRGSDAMPKPFGRKVNTCFPLTKTPWLLFVVLLLMLKKTTKPPSSEKTDTAAASLLHRHLFFRFTCSFLLSLQPKTHRLVDQYLRWLETIQTEFRRLHCKVKILHHQTGEYHACKSCHANSLLFGAFPQLSAPWLKLIMPSSSNQAVLSASLAH